jgi:hypothetical protein
VAVRIQLIAVDRPRCTFPQLAPDGWPPQLWPPLLAAVTAVWQTAAPCSAPTSVDLYLEGRCARPPPEPDHASAGVGNAARHPGRWGVPLSQVRPPVAANLQHVMSAATMLVPDARCMHLCSEDTCAAVGVHFSGSAGPRLRLTTSPAAFRGEHSRGRASVGACTVKHRRAQAITASRCDGNEAQAARSPPVSLPPARAGDSHARGPA